MWEILLYLVMLSSFPEIRIAGETNVAFCLWKFPKIQPDFWSNGKRPCSTVSHSMCHVHNLHAKISIFISETAPSKIFKHPRYLQKVGLVLLNIVKAASILYGANSS